MIAVIKGLTTDYHYVEDRLRLSLELRNGQPLTIWLTQRLALRLVPKLLHWLDRQVALTLAERSASHSTAPEVPQVVHGFAQEVALAELKPVQRVETAGSLEWLTESVELAFGPDNLGMAFRSADGRAAGCGPTAAEVRQWLAVLHGLWLRAGWPPALWPPWMQADSEPSGRQIVVH